MIRINILYWICIIKLCLPLLVGTYHLTYSYLHGNTGSSAVEVSSRLWRRIVNDQESYQRDKAIVFYDIDPFLPSSIRKLVKHQIEFFNNISCFIWYQLSPWEDDQYYKLTFMFKKKDNHCWYAPSSRSDGDGKTDVIWLGEWCVQTLYSSGEGRLRSALLYLMLRATGRYNEHQRPNRDCWLRLDGRLSKEISFHKLSNDRFFSDFPYDYISVMHYPDWAVRGMHSRQENVMQLGRQDGYISDQDYEQLIYLSCGGPSYCQSKNAGPEGVDGWRDNCKTLLQTEQSLAGEGGCVPNIFRAPESYYSTVHQGVCRRRNSGDPVKPSEPDVILEPAPDRPCLVVCVWKHVTSSYYKSEVCMCHTSKANSTSD